MSVAAKDAGALSEARQHQPTRRTRDNPVTLTKDLREKHVWAGNSIEIR